ncbi:MAG: hypothetical protein ACTHXA_12850 [Gulosibacter sp.]|uniref:hypothetical protein n=1 Tax=Gulosibacter sp. TaxID=2817531 RepID=UPI003F909454
MRFILAAVAFVASVVLLAIGGVQYAQASNVSEVTAIGESESAAPLTVISHDTLASRAGTQSVEISGEGEIFVAVGRTDDVQAWVGDTLHNTVTLNEAVETENEHTLALDFAEAGTEPTAPSPAGNDLWFEEHTGEGTLSLDLVVSPGYSLLIASDGTQPAPQNIEVSWPFGGYAPMVGPMLSAGGLLLAIAIGLLVWAIIHRRNRKRAQALAEKRAAEKSKKTAVAGGQAADEETAHEVVDSDAEWSPVAWDTSEAEEQQPTVKITTVPPPVAGVQEDTVQEDTGRADLGEQAAADAPAQDEPMQADPTPDEHSPFAPQPASVPAEHTPAEHEAQPEAAVPVAAQAGTTTDAGEDVDSGSMPVADSVSDTNAASDTAAESDTDADSDRGPGPSSGSTTGTSGTGASAADESKWRRPRGRDRTNAPKRQFFLAPLMAVTVLTLAGCAPQYWPAEWTDTEIAPTGTPTSSVEAALIEEGAMPPTVNEAQLTEIVTNAGELAAEADAAQDASILEPRFTADALQHRTAIYEAQQLDSEIAGPEPFPSGDIAYAIPEATDSWPRVVFVVVSPAEDAPEGSTPAALMLVQESARDNFKIGSLTELAAGVTLPEAAPVSVGAPSLANHEEPLVMPAEEIAAAYADVIANGDSSEFAAMFNPENDTLRSQVNDAYRESLAEELDPEVVTIDFAYAGTDTAPVGITSIDGGAIVSVSITETETLEAANDRALITVSGRTAVLSGVETSETGFVRTYTDQLLFYVPSEATGGPIQFLGVSQAMTDAQELTEEES